MDTQTAPLPTSIGVTAATGSDMIRSDAGRHDAGHRDARTHRPAPARATAAGLSAASVADTGRIRLGAGMRQPGRRRG